jgi:TetR/AcrR family transcriptional repressor of nem operon
VEQARTGIQGLIAALDQGSPDAMEQLLMYTGYWERCIKDQTAPFCLAAILAAELPSLPQEIVRSVRGHFVDLAKWLELVLALGIKQGTMKLTASPAMEAETFMAAVYGAMLAARAFDDPRRFSVIVEAFIHRIRA